MNTKISSIAARLILVGLASSAAAIVPGVAGAGCTGKVFSANKNSMTIHGTGCDDTFKLNQFSNVTVYAGGGNDTIYAGFVGNGGINYVYGEAGNDQVLTSSGRQVWVSGGSGNDTVQGGSGYDAFYGGTGTDTFIGAQPGDFYAEVEKFA